MDVDGSATPCCRSDAKLGSVHADSLETIWNAPAIRDLRLALLRGEAPDACKNCHFVERAGGTSLRQESNRVYERFKDERNKTQIDGALKTSVPIDLGLRFSNLCNFKCRSCNPTSSSSIAQELRAIPEALQGDSVLRAFDRDISALESLIPTLEGVYLVGGEPLLDETHYIFLERLLAAGRKDIRLVYNTNFSTLSYRQWSAPSLWAQFQEVTILASLDAVGARAEVLRKGTRWSKIEENFKRLKDEAPGVKFVVYPTVSAMNAFHLPEALSRFIDLGMLVRPENLKFNILISKECFSLRIFNDQEKSALKTLYRDFMKNLVGIAPETYRAIAAFLDEIIAFQAPFSPAAREQFRMGTFTLDRLRSERFVDVFPELYEVLYGSLES